MRDNYFLYQLGFKLARIIPLKLAYLLAVIISDLRYCFALEDRRAVRKNLEVIFPDKDYRSIFRIRKELFRNFAKYLVDFFSFSKIDPLYIKEKIRIENLDYFDAALAQKKGVIALTAHLGNWELGGVVLAILGYPLWVVALEHQDRKVDEFFNSQRRSKGIQVIPLKKSARQCLRVLTENKVLALVGDRDFTNSGIEIEFFGKKTTLPLGPAAFALNTGAVIVPGFIIRNKDDSFTMIIEKPLTFTPTGNKTQDQRKLVMSYAAIFQEYIRRYPQQWYMFRRFWKD